jgi:hypothetical protein
MPRPLSLFKFARHLATAQGNFACTAARRSGQPSATPGGATSAALRPATQRLRAGRRLCYPATTCRGWVAERLKAPVLKTGRRSGASWVRIPPHPPLSCNELAATGNQGQNFFLFQRCLAEAPEPWRLAPCPISVSERPFVSNRANLAPSGSASQWPAFPMGCAGYPTMHSIAVLPAGIAR